MESADVARWRHKGKKKHPNSPLFRSRKRRTNVLVKFAIWQPLFFFNRPFKLHLNLIWGKKCPALCFVPFLLKKICCCSRAAAASSSQRQPAAATAAAADIIQIMFRAPLPFLPQQFVWRKKKEFCTLRWGLYGGAGKGAGVGGGAEEGAGRGEGKNSTTYILGSFSPSQ